MAAKKLTPKQERYCLEYIKDLNATQAAIRAGYSSKTAYSAGQRMLKDVEIKKRIKSMQAELAVDCKVTAEDIVNEFRKIAFANVSDFMPAGNGPIDLSKLSRAKTAAISSIEITKTGSGKTAITKTKLKLHDKLSALMNLGKHVGIYEKDNEQSNTPIKFIITNKKQ